MKENSKMKSRAVLLIAHYLKNVLPRTDCRLNQSNLPSSYQCNAHVYLILPNHKNSLNSNLSFWSKQNHLYYIHTWHLNFCGWIFPRRIIKNKHTRYRNSTIIKRTSGIKRNIIRFLRKMEGDIEMRAIISLSVCVLQYVYYISWTRV